MSDPVQRIDSLRDNSQFLFAVFYRGHWCPFCLSYMRSLSAIQPSIVAAGGTTVIITAETEDRLGDVRAATGYRGEAINDPRNTIAAEFKKRGLVNVAISDKKGYEHGMAQPAVLVVTKEGMTLESWACVPSMMNLGGASDRPIISEIWDNVQAKLKDTKPVHSRYSSLSALGLLREKIFG